MFIARLRARVDYLTSGFHRFNHSHPYFQSDQFGESGEVEGWLQTVLTRWTDWCVHLLEKELTVVILDTSRDTSH